MNKSTIEDGQPEQVLNNDSKADNSQVSPSTANAVLAAVYGRKISPFDLFMLDVKSNQMIKRYRENLGLETLSNRVDTGDLKMIILALYEMGFDVVERLNK